MIVITDELAYILFMEPYSNFIQTIGKLKESSRHAVVDGAEYSLDSLKEYLHVEREVEKSLKELIIQSSRQRKAQLILVCGNVGDGKSHILSYLKKQIPDEIGEFIIHNDATEAFNPDESFIDTLVRVLDGFKDENLVESSSKVLLAINLGTLNNFLDQQGKDFEKLTNYVKDKGILEVDIIEDNDFEEKSFFQYVNFTDYQLYSLTKDGPVSDILSTLLGKIASKREDNPIFERYCLFREQYYTKLHSPIFYNYEFLCDPDNRESVVQLTIKAIIKSKEIISLRSILNFIYDLIVPLNYQFENDKAFLEHSENDTEEHYLKNILPNYLFEHPELSKVLARIANEDPGNFRSESSDDDIIRIINAEDLSSFIPSRIEKRFLHDNLVDVFCRVKSKKELIIKSFLRLTYFSEEGAHIKFDKSYYDFVRFLYYYNCHDLKELKPLYNIVLDACEKWNGKPGKENRIIIDIGVKQTKFRILVPFNPRPHVKKEETITEEKLNKFNPQLKVSYTSDSKQDNIVNLYIDYGLLNLLLKVTRGYRPNKIDKQSYISFINFLNKLIESDQSNISLEVDEVNIGKNVDYILKLDDFIGQEEYILEIL